MRMKEYAIRCDNFTVIARRDTIGWVWTIEGIVVKYVVLEPDEESAKNGGIEGAKAMLRRRRLPIPDCLIYPRWISNEIV
jgi:hypothetical protein